MRRAQRRQQRHVGRVVVQRLAVVVERQLVDPTAAQRDRAGDPVAVDGHPRGVGGLRLGPGSARRRRPRGAAARRRAALGRRDLGRRLLGLLDRLGREQHEPDCDHNEAQHRGDEHVFLFVHPALPDAQLGGSAALNLPQRTRSRRFGDAPGRPDPVRGAHAVRRRLQGRSRDLRGTGGQWRPRPADASPCAPRACARAPHAPDGRRRGRGLRRDASPARGAVISPEAASPCDAARLDVGASARETRGRTASRSWEGAAGGSEAMGPRPQRGPCRPRREARRPGAARPARRRRPRDPGPGSAPPLRQSGSRGA